MNKRGGRTALKFAFADKCPTNNKNYLLTHVKTSACTYINNKFINVAHEYHYLHKGLYGDSITQ